MPHTNEIINIKQHNKDLQNMVNDLILYLSIYTIDNTATKLLIYRGYRLIGTPVTMEEMKVAILFN